MVHLKTGKGSPVLSQLAWVNTFLIKMIGRVRIVGMLLVVESPRQDDKSMVMVNMILLMVTVSNVDFCNCGPIQARTWERKELLLELRRLLGELVSDDLLIDDAGGE